MPDHPILLFPTPELADRTKKTGGPVQIHKPDLTRQGQRLSPIFNQLQTAFETRRVEIQQSTAGIDPEQVLVIETIGSVENFANAVKRIDGLEWLGEFESEEIIPDQDFYDEKHPEKELTGRLFLVMTNQRALDEMLSLWRHYITEPSMPFEHGLKKFRDVFIHLKSIRRWDVQDRLLDTGIIDIWRKELENDANRIITFETELWYRGNDTLRIDSARYVTELMRQAGGRIISQSVIPDITYHGLLAELPAQAIQEIIHNPTTELVKCENVMFFRPVGQMMVGEKIPEGELESPQISEIPPPTGDPVIALFDGLPLANHRYLANRLIIDDPNNWDADYTAFDRVHGTAMASLIIHGDLNQHSLPLARPIYVRPIMKPITWYRTPRPERIPENILAVDLIHEAVKRLYEDNQEEGPVAPQIKVINISVGDPTRQFVQSMSPLARLLDWLSEKYRVLFIVSAGNHVDAISLGISMEEYNSTEPDELEGIIAKALYLDARNRRLLSPAETINGISVGSAHMDAAQVNHFGDRIDPFNNPLPSPISSFGSGYRRAIKPDIIYSGGRQCYKLPIQLTNPLTIEPSNYRIAPGNQVASPGNIAGELNATSYCCGTSNATALISRAAGICYDSLKQIFEEQAAEIDPSNFEVQLLKAMLVHGCSWGDIGSRLYEILRNSDNGRKVNGLIRRWMGYGMPDVDRVLDCTDQRATLLGFGQLSDGQAHLFSLPLPPSLGSRPEWRRLTVTLAWLSPISTRTQKYRTASLWFEVSNSLVPSRINADWQAVRRGTIQHEVFEGQRAEPFIDGDVIEIKVNCREDAGRILKPISYGLAVSLEVAEGVDIAIYEEISNRIRPSIEIRGTL